MVTDGNVTSKLDSKNGNDTIQNGSTTKVTSTTIPVLATSNPDVDNQKSSITTNDNINNTTTISTKQDPKLQRDTKSRRGKPTKNASDINNRIDKNETILNGSDGAL